MRAARGTQSQRRKETLLEKIEDRVDRRQVCAAEANKKGLGILERVPFMQECINR